MRTYSEVPSSVRHQQKIERRYVSTSSHLRLRGLISYTDAMIGRDECYCLEGCANG